MITAPKLLALGATALLLWTAPGYAQDLPASPDAIATPPLAAFHPAPALEFEIKSEPAGPGASLLFLENHDLPLVEGRLVFDAGSLAQPLDQPGLADLYVEGLREGGCAEFTGLELNAWLDAHAVDLSIAMTEDHLRIEFSCLTEDLEGTLTRIGQLLRSPSFDEEAVEVGRMQLITAIARANDDASLLAKKAMNRLLFGASSRFGQSATTETLAAITTDDLRKYHAANIGIDRLLFGISGDVEAEDATRFAATAVAGMPVAGVKTIVPAPSMWLPDNTTIYVVDRPGVPQTELLFGGPGALITDKDHAALTLWTYVVGAGGMSNRIAQRVRTELGLAYGVGCGFGSGMVRPGQFYAYCGTRNEAVGQAVSEMMDVMTAPNFELIPDDELEAARSRLLGGHVFRYDSAAEQLDRAMTLKLNGLAPNFWETNIKRMGEVTAEEVNLAAVKLISPARFLCVAVGPADEIVAHLETVANVIMIADLDKPAESGTAGQVLVESMLAALGGRELWRDAESVYLKKVAKVDGPFGQISMPSTEWTNFDPVRFRSDQKASNGLVTTTVIRGNKGWVKSAFKLTEMPGHTVSGRRAQMKRLLYLNLHRLAVGDVGLVATATAEGDLMLRENGSILCSFSLDADGTPKSITLFGGGATETISFIEWTRLGSHPFVSKFQYTDGTPIEVTEFSVNPDMDDDLFVL